MLVGLKGFRTLSVDTGYTRECVFSTTALPRLMSIRSKVGQMPRDLPATFDSGPYSYTYSSQLFFRFVAY